MATKMNLGQQCSVNGIVQSLEAALTADAFASGDALNYFSMRDEGDGLFSAVIERRCLVDERTGQEVRSTETWRLLPGQDEWRKNPREGEHRWRGYANVA